MLTRASQAVEDALASDDNHPDDIVRAVLMAVREPDDAMIEAGYGSQTQFHDELLPRPCFTAMIDAILSETP